MQIEFTESADKELQFFVKSGNKAILKKITELIRSITETPFDGIGKPEPLKYGLGGFWSRRITGEHRMV
jgi:toxin YoeB